MILAPDDIATLKTASKMVAAVVFGLAFMWLVFNLVVDLFDDRD